MSFASGARQVIEMDALADYVTESGNPNNGKHVEEVTVTCPSIWLESGVRIVDTPGIGSIYQHNTDVALGYLPQADAVLLIASVDQTLARAELEFLTTIQKYADKIFLLLNKTDYLTEADLREALRFATQSMQSALGTNAQVFPVSAKWTLIDKEIKQSSLARAGFPAFEQALRRFMASEKRATWLRSIAKHLLRIVSQAQLAIDLELAALAAPLDRIKNNLTAFERRKRETLQVKSDYAVLLEAESRKLLKETVEPKLEEFKLRLQNEIVVSIERWFDQYQTLPTKLLYSTVEELAAANIRDQYDRWLERQESEVADRFETLCMRFWGNVHQAVDELLRYSAELFGVQFAAVETEPLWRAESAFYYKSSQDTTSLAILSSALSRTLPRFIGARWTLNRVKRRAIENIDAQAGRIRYDFDERLKKNTREFRGELVERIDATILGIATAIEHAIAMRARGEMDAHKIQSELTQTRMRLTSVELRLREFS